MERKLSRRRFLARAGAAAAGLTVLGLGAQCGPTPTPEIIKETVIVEKPVEKVVKETVVKEVEKVVKETVVIEVVKEVPPAVGELVVNYLTPLWVWQKMNAANATERYNQINRGTVRLQVDPAPDGWQTKVREMVLKGEVKWDGALCNQSGPYGGEIGLVKMGIIEPPGPYLDASKDPWAAKLMDDLTPVAEDFFTYEGKVWYIPWDSELYIRHYRTEEWGKLGETPAETIDEYKRQLLELKKMYPDKMGICGRRDGGCDHMLQQMFPEDPYIQVDMAGGKQWALNAMSDAYAYVLDFYKWAWENNLIDEESWSPGAFGPWVEIWNRGDGLSTMTGAAWAFAQARKIWGRDAIDAEPIPVLQAGTTPATHTFSNGASIFTGAPHAQEVVDYMLWMTNPEPEGGTLQNYSYWKGIMDYYHVPAYKSVFETHLPLNPEWKWMEKMLPMLENSKAEPRGSFWEVWNTVKDPWKLKYCAGECTLKECQEAIWEEGLVALEKFVTAEKK